MDVTKTEFEFLDLTNVKESELSCLQSALYDTSTSTSNSSIISAESSINRCRESTDTVSSLESGIGGECDMAPHSPARGTAQPPQHTQSQPPVPPHHVPHFAPPPTYPPHQHQWQPVAPPNVYVSQVTANVNVHGYMGQYYQPPQQHYPQSNGERAPRNRHRDRRNKRLPSPPAPQPPPAPFYLQYPYYSTPQAQGAPLYHLPVYQPVVYNPYAYQQYYDYPIPVEGESADKGPEEYSQEMVMEQEAVDGYYTGPYPGPQYGPSVEGGVEYAPPMYLQPPPQPPPVPVPQLPPHQPVPHQFNVHAKNFVQMNHNKTYTPADKNQESKTPPDQNSSTVTTTVKTITATMITATTATTSTVESLPVKDLKISNKQVVSTKQTDRHVDDSTKISVSNDKVSSMPKSEPVKATLSPVETKAPETTAPPQTPKTFVQTSNNNNTPTNYQTNKITPIVNKTKGPAAPFSGSKQAPKPSIPQAAVPVQQVTAPKPPFGNRQKRDGTINKSPTSEISNGNSEKPVEHRREPPIQQSKAPVLSITLHSQGPPVVTSKSPFGQSRKASAPEPPPVPQPPPPAPTASDFPPPPKPRNRVEPVPPPVQPQPQPAPGKSWASLFNKTPISTPPQQPITTTEEPPSPTTANPVVNVQKPVAKVPPFDASPLQAVSEPKTTTTRPPTTTPNPTISYSEKTSVSVVNNANKPSSPNQTSDVKEIMIQKEKTPPLPVHTSPFADDPNCYRMGEFLVKYTLEHHAVGLIPRGLTNRSNYCYVNAILQALIACPPFYNMLKALPYQTRRRSSTPVIDSLVQLCYEFSALSTSGRNMTRVGRGTNTEGVVTNNVPAGPPLEGGVGLKVLHALRPFVGAYEGKQEDAEEFLGCLLNSLNDEMLELIKLVEPDDKEVNNQPNGVIPQSPEEENEDEEWKVMGPRNKGAVERRWAARRTPVADIFRGRTRVRLHRTIHHDVTDAVQPFFTLQLDIERSSSVKDALELLANKDTLEGVSDAWQQLSLEELPVVLLLHLKCFQLGPDGATAKIVKNFDFPIDLKVDPKIMSSKAKHNPKERTYKLFAVVYHEGVEAVKGHYLTDTFHGQAGWIRYDDSTVTHVNTSQVLKPKAPRMPYLLMYRRLDTLPQNRKPE